MPFIGSILILSACKISVCDAESGWSVPLVEMRTVNGQTFVSDNAGTIAVTEPDLLGRKVWFDVQGHGYGVQADDKGREAVVLALKDGATLKVPVQRRQPAKRLGRIGGSGLFADSRKLGEHLDKVDQGETGRDSVQCAAYRGRLFWLWGDTSMQDFALGIFNTTAAFTPNPAFRKLEPPIYPPYDQIVNDKGRIRGTIKTDGPGPVWMFGLVTLKDRKGAEHLVCPWTKVRGGGDGSEIMSGLAEWNDAAKKAILELGDMRPGHLSSQKRASGRNVREYTQLSYTFQKRSRTDYVQPEDLERIKAEVENYKKFKELCERLVALSIEESKRKTAQRLKEADGKK